MGYFDGLTNGSFKKDRNGNTVFFPWGAFGRGRVLPDESTEITVRGFVRRYLQVALSITIGVGIIFGWAWPFLLVPVFGAWYYFGTMSLVSGCPHSEDKLTLKESYTSAAASHNKVTLWLLFVCSALFVLGGIFMATMAKSSGQMIVGLLTVALFGAGAAAIGYMLKVKRDAQR